MAPLPHPSPDTALLLGGPVVLGLLYFVYWQLTTGARRRAIIKERGCLPVNQYPSKDGRLGLYNFKALANSIKTKTALELTASRFDEMGLNTFAIDMLARRQISTIEPENLKYIQSLDFKSWSIGSARIRNMTVLFGPGIFTTDGLAWQHSREMLRPNFARNQVRDFGALEKHVAHLTAAVPRDGSTVDLQDLFFRFTIDSATEFLFGESTNTLAPGLSTVSASKFAEHFTRGQSTVGERNRRGRLDWTYRSDTFDTDVKHVQGFVDGIVDAALARREKLMAEDPESSARYVFINELVRQTTDKYQIRSEALNILLAGRDTTASLLSNVWFVLSRRSDVWQKLRGEVDPLNGELPTFDQMKDMKYLRAVLNESLRLHPVVPFNSREAVCDTWLPHGGGSDGKSPMLVKKGMLVSWSTYVMHRRKDFFGDDADEFNPDRWLGDKGLRPGWEYLPFNGGPRICLGQQFALTEASYVTVRLMQEFKTIESRDNQPWRENLTLTCCGEACKVGLTPFSNA